MNQRAQRDRDRVVCMGIDQDMTTRRPKIKKKKQRRTALPAYTSEEGSCAALPSGKRSDHFLTFAFSSFNLTLLVDLSCYFATDFIFV